MLNLSSNPIFDTFTQRALLQSCNQGADFGECLITLSRIGNGTVDEWYQEWVRTADRLTSIADDCLRKNHLISARETYLRATTYYHIAYLPLFGQPVDPRLIAAFDKETKVFHRAAALFKPAIEIIEIPYENRTLPAYFLKVDDSGIARPTVIHTNGYDSNIQEMYFNHGLAAIRRGYNCLLFDGPGQGRNLIRDALPIRHDWENVVKPVVDYALSRKEVDPNNIVLVGWSFGGFLAPRAAAFEHRIAALIADPGQWDIKVSLLNTFPLTPEEKAAFPNIDPRIFRKIEEDIRQHKQGTLLYWRLIQRGLWVHGANNVYEYVQDLLKYEISSVAKQISCPTLLTFAEGDPIAKYAVNLYEALQVPKKLLHFTQAEGAADHCEAMARSLYQQRVFDWLDEIVQSHG